MNGTDWAYARLVKTARNSDKRAVRSLAKVFKREVLAACVINAVADMDWYSTERNMRPYTIVRDICIELTRGR